VREETLRELYGEAMDLSAPRERDSCPSLEHLSAVVEGTVPEHERLELMDHVMACRTCQEEFELFRALKVARKTPSRRWRPYAVAASLVLIGGSAALWATTSRYSTSSPVYRSSPDFLTLVSPADGRRIGLPAVLTWHSVAGATRYRIELLDSQGSPAFTGQTTDTALHIRPQGAVAAGEYRWFVTASMADGTEVRSSPRRIVIIAR
jgi:hypothetical protein